eukprot:5633951-Pleurochrysis_carterae.AAC.1
MSGLRARNLGDERGTRELVRERNKKDRRELTKGEATAQGEREFNDIIGLQLHRLVGKNGKETEIHVLVEGGRKSTKWGRDQR